MASVGAAEETLTKHIRERDRQTPQLAGRNHRENIAGRIFEPRYRWTIPMHNPFLVRLNVREIINLKTHAALCEFIDRLIHVIHREIKAVNVAGV